MNIIDHIQEAFPTYTKNEREIAFYIINHPMEAGRTTIEALAYATNTSKAAIVRFTKKLGFEGYSEFKYALSRFLVSNNAEVSTNYQSHSALDIVDLYAERIKQMKQMVKVETLDALIKDIIGARRIRIFGISRSFFSASQLEARLLRIGIESKAITDSIIIGDTINVLDENDLVIIFSVSNNTLCYGAYIRDLKARGCKVAFLTMASNLPLAKDCDYYITLPRVSYDKGFAFMDDQAIFFIFIEVMLSELGRLLEENNSK